MLYIGGDMNNTIVKDEVKIENLIENLGILVSITWENVPKKSKH